MKRLMMGGLFALLMCGAGVRAASLDANENTTAVSPAAAPQNAADAEEPAGLEMEFVMQLRVTLGGTYQVGQTPHGTRTVIPITGGEFEGPRVKGTIINGGADYQLANNGRTEVEAIYSIKTHDDVYIHVRNRGLICMEQGKDGQMPSFYFRTAPQFEAPADSPYAWLNNSIYVCAPAPMGNGGGITLNVWRIK